MTPLLTALLCSNPSEGVLDMDGIRDLQPFFDMAKETGIWIIARPGPFANAETSGGGIPGWVIRKGGDMRTNSTDYFDSWQLYWDAITQLVANNQISQGGPVVLFQLENEFDRGVFYDPHMEELKESARRNGITVPLTHNNPRYVRCLDGYATDPRPQLTDIASSPCRGRGHWSAGPGAVDIAAVDAYPVRLIRSTRPLPLALNRC
jgi:beta-galactosidase GanA